MRTLVLVTAAAFSLGAFSSTPAAESATLGTGVQTVIPFAQDAIIAGAVKRECGLGEKLSMFTMDYAREKGVVVTRQPEVSNNADGRVLVMEISDAVADGNAFIGHHTHTTVKGRLYQDHQQTGSFIARRNSMGGAFGGFKGNCSVLGRTVKALGEDIAGWLTHPVEGAMLGDLN